MMSVTVSPANARTPREHLVEDDAERPDVRALVDRFALAPARRHVGGRAEDHAGCVMAGR